MKKQRIIVDAVNNKQQQQQQQSSLSRSLLAAAVIIPSLCITAGVNEIDEECAITGTESPPSSDIEIFDVETKKTTELHLWNHEDIFKNRSQELLRVDIQKNLDKIPHVSLRGRLTEFIRRIDNENYSRPTLERVELATRLLTLLRPATLRIRTKDTASCWTAEDSNQIDQYDKIEYCYFGLPSTSRSAGFMIRDMMKCIKPARYWAGYIPPYDPAQPHELWPTTPDDGDPYFPVPYKTPEPEETEPPPPPTQPPTLPPPPPPTTTQELETTHNVIQSSTNKKISSLITPDPDNKQMFGNSDENHHHHGLFYTAVIMLLFLFVGGLFFSLARSGRFGENWRRRAGRGRRNQIRKIPAADEDSDEQVGLRGDDDVFHA